MPIRRLNWNIQFKSEIQIQMRFVSDREQETVNFCETAASPNPLIQLGRQVFN